MSEKIFGVQSERFHLLDRNQYIVQGIRPKGARMQAYLDGRKLKTAVKAPESVQHELRQGEKITVEIELPDDISGFRKLMVCTEINGRKTQWFSISVKALEKKRDKPQVYFEEERFVRGMCV